MANMDIILLERVEKLGNIGDVVSVKPGFARNFLLPKGKALRANEANRATFEADRERIEKENAEKRSAAEKAGEQLSGTQVTMIRQSSDSGQLYGSVSARDIATALVEANVARSKEEAEMQAEGIDIFAGDDDDDMMSASERAAAEALARAEAQADAEARGEVFEEGAGPATDSEDDEEAAADEDDAAPRAEPSEDAGEEADEKA